ncbi:autotransporter outer membrane beta-barrel domain-containing protein [Salimicrobium halophilum]|uniref:Ig-like domain (Group 3) n=1 Tax=Salimicrobium halophilum TaxID=86666 RepID=A0A1G8SEK7_9BACI|nr:hypothetical protein [Salimicrobium halophilum]SDJ27631.1 hypothetical protein SAMN04490247_1416 [Salimicrobium halophilum]
MKTPFKVMTAAAIAGAVAVPAAATPAAAAATPDAIAFEMDGEVTVVQWEDYIDAIADGEGELYDYVMNASPHAVSVEEGKFIEWDDLVDAIVDAEEGTESADVLEDLAQDENTEFVPEETVNAWNDGMDEEVTVESVSAITPTTVEVTFNQEVEAFDRNDVTIEGEDGDRVFVSNVELAEDGQSATLTLYDELTDESSYDVTVESGEETLTDSFDFLYGEIAEIQVQNQTIKADTATEIEYEVLTDTGLNVTDSTDVTFNSTVPGSITGDEITLADGESAFVTISAGDETSDRFRVTANASEAVELGEYTVDTTGSMIDWDADDFEADYDVAVDQDATLETYFVDQYGEAAAGDVTFESLTPSVLIVDESTGELTPRTEGTADVRVTNGSVSEIVTIEVVEAAEFTNLSFSQDGDLLGGDITLNPNVENGQETVAVNLQDQYGDDFAADETLTVEVDGDSVDVTNLDNDSDASNGVQIDTGADGEVNLDLETVDGESGTSTVTVMNSDGTITGSFDVNVEEAGEIADYNIEGAQELDLNTSNTDTAETTALKVFPVDENDVKVSDAVDATWTITDENGDELSVSPVTTTDGELNLSTDGSGEVDLDTEGTYTFEATVGSLEVATETVEVVDTEAPYDVTQTDNSVEVGSTGGDLFAAVKGALEITQDGSTVDVSNIDSVEVLSDDTSVISEGGEATFTLNSTNTTSVIGETGDATLFIDSIMIDGKNVPVDFQMEASVTDTTAGDAPTLASTTVASDDIDTGSLEITNSDADEALDIVISTDNDASDGLDSSYTVENDVAANTATTLDYSDVFQTDGSTDGEYFVYSVDDSNNYEQASNTITVDASAPMLTSAAGSDATTILVSSNEDLANVNASGAGFTVTDGDSTDYAVTAASLQTGDDSVIELTVADYSGATGDINVSFTTQTDEYEDAAGNDTESTTSALTFTP